MALTPIPGFTAVPQVGQSEATFDANADTFVSELPAFIASLNQLGQEIPAEIQAAISTLDQSIAWQASLTTQATGNLRMFLTAQGQPTWYFGFPKMTWDELRPDGLLGTAVHQAFMDGTTEMSTRWIAAYPLSLASTGEVVSQPGTLPLVNKTLDEEIALCAGTQIGGVAADANQMMSIWDWSLVYYWMQVNGYQPIGNTSYGKSHEKPYIKGQGVTSVKSGSMGAEARHNGQPDGIDGLTGNVWKRLSRMYLDEGRVMLQNDNGGVPSLANCTALDYWFSGTSGATQIVESLSAQVKSSGAQYTTTAGASGFAAIDGPGSTILQQACLEPIADASDLKGGNWVRSHLIRAPLRGGGWKYTSSCGPASLSLASEPSSRNSSIGFFSAFSS